ncbi:MAG: RNA polymerase sigma-70 factor [Tannerella sp.]|nr:RNA polymerase sigma-70 factor [Tannerella sp.]
MEQDSEIVKGLKAGQDAAYRHLYEHHYKALCTVAFEYVNDRLASEMIVSDVIFAIWQNRNYLEINTSLRSYLVKSVRNRSLNYLAQAERQETLRQHIGKEIETGQMDDSDNPLTQLIEKELDKKINDSIEALSEQTRKIFCMSRFDNLKYEEIADKTGVSVDVVKYHIKSALARLRISLKEYF